MIMLFDNKRKVEDTEMYNRVNDWCTGHTNEVREIRNYISMQMHGKYSRGSRRPSKRLLERAVRVRRIRMPFTSNDLLSYSTVNFFR